MPTNWAARDRKVRKRQSLKMVVDGLSTKTVIAPTIEKKYREVFRAKKYLEEDTGLGRG